METKHVSKRIRENNLKSKYFPRTTSLHEMQNADHVTSSFDEKIKKWKQLTIKQQQDVSQVFIILYTVCDVSLEHGRIFFKYCGIKIIR